MSSTMSSRGVHKQIDKNALLVAQEITFAKILSGNDPKIRERGVKRLRSWLTARSSSTCPFKENDLKRIWKGLFYCMWMSDKPLVQEEVAENISKLVHCFKDTKAFICFVKCFFSTMAVEWRGLDSWRMDKFLMFVRRFMRQVFMYCDQHSWPLNLVNELGAVFNRTILPDHKALSDDVHPPTGFSMHFVDVYMDELTKVSRGHLQNDDLLVALLRPFALYLSQSPEVPVSTEIVSNIFDRLIEQSTEGHKFREKFEAWKQLGFPRGTIEAVERVDTGSSDEEADDEAEEEESALDPRAGGVNVELPVANYNPEVVVNLLREYRHAKTSTAWSRKTIARVMARFNSLTQGKYPLGIKKVDKVPKINFKQLAKKSALALLEFRDKIMNEDDDEWIESIQNEKVQKKGKNKSAQKKGTQAVEDDESEEEDEEDDDVSGSDDDISGSDDYISGSDDDIDEDGDVEGDEDVDSDEDDDVDVDEEEDVDSDEDDDVDIDDDGDVNIDDDVGSDEDDDVDIDEDGDDDADDENDDVVVDGTADEPEDDDAVADVQGDDDVNNDNGDLIESEKEDDKLKSEVSEEPVKVSPGKRNKNKKNNILITPEKQKPKNSPQVIPSSLNKNQKNNQSSEEITPQKKNVKNAPRVIENGISKSPKKQLSNENVKKDENVIIVGRKRKLADALSTPLIHRGKHLKSPQNSPKTPQTPGSAKRVHFILQRNTAQATSEYDKVLRENPGNPYDSAKKPRFSVLKTTPLASPVNPFYKH